MGQNDFDPSLSIGNEAQSCLNVETSLNGSALRKRSGYTRVGSLPVSTSPATGVASFIDTSGNKQQVVCSDHYCSKSTNGGAFSTFLSTAGGTCMPTRWSFASNLGNLYGANDCHDPVFQYNGTTFISLSTGAPLGSLLEATKDRLVISGVATVPSGVYYSQSGVFNNFITGILSASAYTDFIGSSGDQVRAIKFSLGRLFIFKTNSIVSCILGDQYTSKCYPVSNTIGTVDPNSIVEVPTVINPQGIGGSGALMFRGSDNNFWQLDGTGLGLLSKKILNLVKSQTSGQLQNNTQTGQTAWQAGTQFPTGSWNTISALPGIIDSSVTFSSLGVNTTDWAMVDVDTTSGVSSFVSNSDGSGLDSMWTVYSGTITNVNHAMTGNSTDGNVGTDSISTQVSISTGIWSFVFKSSYTGIGSAEFWFVDSSTSMAGSNQNAYALRMKQQCNLGGGSACWDFITTTISPTQVIVISSGTNAFFDSTSHTFKVTRSSNGYMEGYVDGSLFMSVTDLHVLANTWTNFKFVQSGSQSSVTKFKLPGFYQNQRSTPYFTAFTTNTWGPYNVGLTSAAASSVTFNVQFATASSGPYSNFISQTPGSKLSVAQATMSYVRNQEIMSAPSASPAATLISWNLTAATTGQFVTQCIQPGSGITAWGQLSCGTSTGGNGSVVFYATSAATCATLPATPPGSWAPGAVTNNATLSISTNVAAYIGFVSLLGSATDYAQVNSCTLNWQNGTATPPTWGTYDPLSNAAYWNIAINNSATANRVLKYDMNLNEWYPFGLNATAIYRDPIYNAFYFGDSASGFWNQYGNGVTSDNGAAINAFWISRDFGNQTYPFVDNTYSRISMIGKNEPSGTVNVTYTFNTGQTGTYTMSVSTTSAWNYVHMNQALLQASPFQFMNVNIGNNSTTPFEIDAMAIDYSSFGWSPANP